MSTMGRMDRRYIFSPAGLALQDGKYLPYTYDGANTPKPVCRWYFSVVLPILCWCWIGSEFGSQYSFFSKVQVAPTLEHLALKNAFDNDPYPNKVDLRSGTHRTEKDEPFVFPVVKTVERILANDESLTKEYLPILGLYCFSASSVKLILGEDSTAILENRSFGIQCISGTGALRTGSEFLVRYLKKKVIYCSDPSWENHERIFKYAGFEEYRKYRYWDPKTHGLDFDGLVEDLQNAEEGSVILLHVCAHNPTGVDPDREQWNRIAKIFHEKKIFPFFDSAYQGFASGDLDEDAYPVRLFVSLGFELFCAQSYAKTLGIYSERVGHLTIVVNDSNLIPNISLLMGNIRIGICSHSPDHGARIITYILNNPEMRIQWERELKRLTTRVANLRKQLRDSLELLQTPGDWKYITRHIGLYSYIGLTEAQILNLVKVHHIYLYKEGRISFGRINIYNVNYVAKAIHETVISLPETTKKHFRAQIDV